MRSIAALCLILAPLAAAAQPLAGEVDGVRYLSGGADEAGRTAMRRDAEAFSLRLQFAAGEERRYVSDVQVAVRDTDGEPVLDLPYAGPLLFLDLPTGHYVVHARLGDAVHTQVVAVGIRPGRIAAFHWPEHDPDG